MLLLRALLLWSVVSVHVVGGAVLFRRLFGRDYDWYGFFVPMLALCLGLNFIEYFVPVPTLLWLLPFTTIGSLLLLVRPGFDFRAGVAAHPRRAQLHAASGDDDPLSRRAFLMGGTPAAHREFSSARSPSPISSAALSRTSSPPPTASRT